MGFMVSFYPRLKSWAIINLNPAIYYPELTSESFYGMRGNGAIATSIINQEK
jgi:hypothetical protein